MAPSFKSAMAAHVYYTIVDAAVKIEVVLSKEERDELVSVLLKTAEQEKEEYPTLFLQAAINYTRGVSE